MKHFTMQTVGWEPRLPPVDDAHATPEQQAALDACPPGVRSSKYFLTLAQDPRSLGERGALFNSVMYAPRGLPRAERELATATVSIVNGCVYCASVHARRFAELTHEPETMQRLLDDGIAAPLDARRRAIVDFAAKLTATPGDVAAADLVPLRAAGLDDLELLDLIHSIAMFANANRLMQSLGNSVPPEDLARTAREVFPAGNLGNMDGDIIIRSGHAGRITDTEGREYVDFLIGSGPMLVGHAHPEVLAATQAQIAQGSTFFATNEPCIRLAAAIVDALPCADQVRFTSSGTEADMYAMRAARAFRRRDKILKFEGGYHGMSDDGMLSIWPKTPGNFPQASIDSAGIPASARDHMLVAPFNDLAAAEALIRAHHDDLAGVIVEPMQRLIPPVPGFLQGLRAITAEYGIPLIFDEIVTGFRLAYGGAQTYYGVTPDLCTLGKVIGGGFPLAAIAGRADIMAHFDRAAVGTEDFMPQIGTLSGNPAAAAAGLATLAILRRPGAYDRLFATGTAIRDALRQALEGAGFEVQVPGEPPMFDAVFTATPIHDYRTAATGDAALNRRFNALLRQHGVFKSAGKIYVSAAHDAADVALAAAAFTAAAQALREAPRP